MRILVLGAGFGGLELSTQLSEEFGDALDIVLIDRSDGFIFGFSKLDVMFGRSLPASVLHPYSDLAKPGLRFVQTTIRAIDPVAKRVETDAGVFEADVMVVALGADLDPSATPGLVEAGHEFYTVPGAFALRDVLPLFERRSCHRRSDVHSVQVSAGAERDRSADARLPDAAGDTWGLRDLPRHAPGRAHPTLTGGVRSSPRRLRRAGDPLASREAGEGDRPDRQGRLAQ